jgi:hypothetical protein
MNKKKKIVEPGVWYVVRFRRLKSFEQITGYMCCKNRYHAGHNGWSRKMRYVKGLGKRGPLRYVPRKWDLQGHSYRRLAYKFEDLKDLRTSIRSKLVKDWMAKWDGILEVIEIHGCRKNGVVTSERVVDRRFNATNEMEILALEHALGE